MYPATTVLHVLFYADRAYFRFLKSEASYAAWKDIPTTYVMIADARGKGANIDVERIQSSHSPFLSRPQRIADIVRRVAGREQ
jgi:hypothetical protein